MKSFNKIVLTSIFIPALCISHVGHSETITTKTIVSQQDIPNVQKTNFSAFDLNGDNILSMSEVGQKLFYVFDTDGNEVLDNIEFNNKKIMTIIPMEKMIYTFIDEDSDGRTDKTSYSYETFIQKSHLMRFDNNMDGLSPSEFIGHSFLSLDADNSKAIELDEWKKAYIASIAPPVAEQDRYN